MSVLGLLLALLGIVLAAPPDARIVGGGDAVPGNYPYQVALEFCTTTCVQICGGAILSNYWVITAGHCITDVTVEGAFSILAGVVDLDGDNPERQLIRATHGILHPDFQGGSNPHDLALFRLSSPLEFNSLVQPISLPEPGQEIYGVATLTGWGAIGAILDDIPVYPNTLQTVDVPIIGAEECTDILDNVLQGGQHPLNLDANICSGPTNGQVASCIGDSGSPLVQNNILVGLVSWGIRPCGSNGAPSSVFTKVSHYVHWIRAEVDDLP